MNSSALMARAAFSYFFLHLCPIVITKSTPMHKSLLLAGILFIQNSMAQQKMSPELLWQLGRVSGETVTADGTVLYGVSRYDLKENKSERNLYGIPVGGGTAKQLTTSPGAESGAQVLPNGRILYSYKL
jgi:hypothetical protein